MQIDLRPPVALDHQPRDVGFAGRIAACRDGETRLRRGGPEALAKHDVHHLLFGAIAVFQRHFLGQDFDALDGFGRNVAKLAEAGNALAVEQHDRPLAAATLRADLRRESFQELVDVACAGGADIPRIERVLGRDIADH